MMNIFFLVFWLSSLFCYGHGQMVGNPDDTAKIERPCPTYDLNCIRTFFENHAHCRKSFGPVPHPLERAQSNFDFARANFSVSVVNPKVGGLNGRVEEFYINRETDNLIISVEFNGLSQTSNNTFFKFHRRARESVVTAAFTTVTFESVIITAVIPNIHDLQLHKAECTTFSNDLSPSFFIAPTAVESTDPQPDLAIASFMANLPNNVQMFFLTQSTYYIATYIQYNICDFGLLLT